MTSAPIISCRGVSKTFRDGRDAPPALADLDFDLSAGEIIGLLGPDGSGKTTLLRLLSGLYHPTRGEIRVLELDTVRETEELQRSIGYMPQKFGLYENLSVEENLRLYAELHGVAAAEQESRFDELLNLTALAPFRQRMAGQLSGGMKQKLALACALVSRPPLLLLDEPTVGVDVLSRRELWNILRRLVDRGEMTVLSSTAYLDEAGYCDRVLVLYQGRLVSNGRPEELRRQAAGQVDEPTFEDGFQILLSGRLQPPLKRNHPSAPGAPVMIKAENILKTFGDFVAVNRISFEVRRGEIFGLLGANGAGKTTTFRMLCGLSAADAGTIEIAGNNLHSAALAAREKIGFVAQKFSLYSDLSVINNLEFFGGAYGLTGRRLRDRLAWALEAFDLQRFRHTITARLPQGYKQRLSMACALLHEPEILFLDEATSGADPMARHEFWERIITLADHGVTVIITTHFLDEAEYCDRMLIMQDGVASACGSAADIRLLGHAPSLEEAFVNIIRDSRRKQETA